MLHPYVKRFFRILFKTIACFIGMVAIYMALAWLFSRIKVNSDFTEDKNAGIPIFILSNGVHTDIVLPARNKYKDWYARVNPAYSLSADTTFSYVAFGWGDKGFYLNTPTWADLKFSTAFNAMFFLSSTAMHVTFYRQLNPDENCVAVMIPATNYAKLVNYIETSFQKDSVGNYLPIPNARYADNDCFYEANDVYNLFFTCNTWVNSALKESNLKACFWTPFNTGILRHYR